MLSENISKPFAHALLLSYLWMPYILIALLSCSSDICTFWRAVVEKILEEIKIKSVAVASAFKKFHW